MNATHPPSYIGSPRYDHQFRVWTNCASSINAQSASLNVRTGHQPPAELDHIHLPRAPSSWLGGPRWFPVVPGGLLWFQVIIQQVRWSPSEHVDKLQSSMHWLYSQLPCELISPHTMAPTYSNHSPMPRWSRCNQFVPNCPVNIAVCRTCCFSGALFFR